MLVSVWLRRQRLSSPGRIPQGLRDLCRGSNRLSESLSVAAPGPISLTRNLAARSMQPPPTHSLSQSAGPPLPSACHCSTHLAAAACLGALPMCRWYAPPWDRVPHLVDDQRGCGESARRWWQEGPHQPGTSALFVWQHRPGQSTEAGDDCAERLWRCPPGTMGDGVATGRMPRHTASTTCPIASSADTSGRTPTPFQADPRSSKADGRMFLDFAG